MCKHDDQAVHVKTISKPGALSSHLRKDAATHCSASDHENETLKGAAGHHLTPNPQLQRLQKDAPDMVYCERRIR